MLYRKLYNYKPYFFDVVAGALIGGAIKMSADALHNLTLTPLFNTLFSFGGITAICLAGVELVRIARILEEINDLFDLEKAVELQILIKKAISEQPELVQQKFDQIEQTESENNNELRQKLLEKRSRELEPIFSSVFYWTSLGIALFIASGLSYSQLSQQIPELWHETVGFLKFIMYIIWRLVQLGKC